MPENRNAHPDVERLIVERWSPRAFDGSEVPASDLHILFDAARWAPSAYNVQPWRFLYARRGDANWQRFLHLLLPGNRMWAENAGALIYVLSDRMMKMKEELVVSHSHSFDAGAAWAMLALQAIKMGYHTHPMVGIDMEQARIELQIPERYRLEAAIVVGRRGDPSALSETLQAREKASDRRPVEEFAFAGPFPQG